MKLKTAEAKTKTKQNPSLKAGCTGAAGKQYFSVCISGAKEHALLNRILTLHVFQTAHSIGIGPAEKLPTSMSRPVQTSLQLLWGLCLVSEKLQHMVNCHYATAFHSWT